MELILRSSKIPGLGEQDGFGANAIVHVKLFYGTWTWLLTEYDRDNKLAFGFAYNASMPECAELGYISIEELAASQHPIERDIHFKPKTLAEAKEVECKGLFR